MLGLLGSLLEDGNAGYNFENSCVAATTANLTATYANGAGGVNATLTNSGALAAFSVDGQTPSVGARILVKDQSTQTQNGIYVLTVAGSGSVAWVLTRASDYDIPSQINSGDVVPVSAGTQNIGSLWRQTATVAIIGTDNIVFAGFFLPSNYVAKAGDTMTGNLSAPKVAIGTTDFPAIDTIGEGLVTGASLDGVTQTTRTSRSRIGDAELNFVVNHLHSASNWIKNLFLRSNGDTSTHVSVTNGQVISGNYYAGRYQSGGTGSYYLAASDEVGIDDTGTISATSMPGKRTRSITPDGSKTPVVFETVTNGGNITFSYNIKANQVRSTSNTESLSGNKTLTTTSEQYQFLNPNGSNRDVNLPAGVTDMLYFIKNTGSAGDTLIVKDSGGTAVTGGTIANTVIMGFFYNGSSWQLV